MHKYNLPNDNWWHSEFLNVINVIHWVTIWIRKVKLDLIRVVMVEQNFNPSRHFNSKQKECLNFSISRFLFDQQTKLVFFWRKMKNRLIIGKEKQLDRVRYFNFKRKLYCHFVVIQIKTFSITIDDKTSIFTQMFWWKFVLRMQASCNTMLIFLKF